MARENQGLQIALIIFVMLTVVMSVMWFFYFKKYDETDRKAQVAVDHAVQADAQRLQTEAESKELKRIIGFASSKTTQDITHQFDDDMKEFGHWPEDVRFYSPILHQLVATIKAKDNEIAAKKALLDQQKKEFAQREETWKEQIATAEKAAADAGTKLVDVTKEADQGRQETMEQQQKLAALVDNVKKANREENEHSKEEIQKLHGTIDQYAGINVTLNKKLGSYTRTYPDRFCGEVRFVNQRESTVWIDRGWADGLDRQVTFSVYSGDTTDLAKAAKKASIEVTKVTDEHMAMARILDDKSTDPIVQGDKLFTPAWAPGEQKHFALVGFLDSQRRGQGRSSRGQEPHSPAPRRDRLRRGRQGQAHRRDDGQHELPRPRRAALGKGADRGDGRLHQAHHRRRPPRCPHDFLVRSEGADGLPESIAGEAIRGRRPGRQRALRAAPMLF